MAEFISRAELPLICFLRAWIVLIKGGEGVKKKTIFTLLFILNHGHYESRASSEMVIAAKKNIMRDI